MLPTPITILIADDHPIFRQGLKLVIELDPSLKVVAEADNGQDALAKIEALQPQIALLDVDMPLGDGFEIARELRQKQAEVKIVFLTLYKDEMHLTRALDLGAEGYLVKDSAATEVVECIKTVVAGSSYISPVLATYELKRRASQDRLFSTLTGTERRVLARLAEFKTSKQIALELGVSIRTIENHRANICEKLNLQGAHALVRFALQHLKSLT